MKTEKYAKIFLRGPRTGKEIPKIKLTDLWGTGEKESLDAAWGKTQGKAPEEGGENNGSDTANN